LGDPHRLSHHFSSAATPLNIPHRQEAALTACAAVALSFLTVLPPSAAKHPMRSRRLLPNLILPSGTEKIGRFEYLIGLNSSPDIIEKLNAIPIKSLPNGTTVYIRDVANILNLPGNSNF
jgi:hypothetical protein